MGRIIFSLSLLALYFLAAMPGESTASTGETFRGPDLLGCEEAALEEVYMPDPETGDYVTVPMPVCQDECTSLFSTVWPQTVTEGGAQPLAPECSLVWGGSGTSSDTLTTPSSARTPHHVRA